MKIGQVPALSVWTHPTAQEALAGWLAGHDALPVRPESDPRIADQSDQGAGLAVGGVFRRAETVFSC